MRSATKKRVQLRCVHECEDSMSWAIFDFIKARTGRRHDFDDSQQQRQGHESRKSKKMYNLVYEIATVIRPLYPRYILWVFYVVQTGKHWVIPMTGSFYMMSFCPCIYLSFVKLSGKNIVTVWFLSPLFI